MDSEVTPTATSIAAGPESWAATPDVVETHISIIVFIGDRAYKFHKPVKTAFLDHSSRPQRERACHEEVAVNRRFSPDVYLGVANITSSEGRLLDHAIVMKRMPADRQLSALLDDPVAAPTLDAVAQILSSAHRETPAVRREGAGDASQMRRLWDEGLEQLRPFVPDILPAETVTRVDRESHRYLIGRQSLFDLRVAEGHVRDGHGDLLADDIYCLPDGPRILDALAFDPQLRIGDTLSDAAFLAMDLESRGHPALGARFLAAHTAALNDRFPPSLVYHYLAYRAFVRAKIACLAAAQGRADKAARARELLALSDDYLCRGSTRLILIGGPPGTGKSTVAAGLAEACGFRLVSSDATRRQQHQLGDAPAPGSFRRGLYAPERTEAIYGTMLEQARAHLRLGYSVVLDASWSRRDHRADARRVAESCTADLHEMRCHIDPELADQRIIARRRIGDDPSDATVAIARRMRAEFHTWPDAKTLVTADAPEVAVRAAARMLGLELPQPPWVQPLAPATSAEREGASPMSQASLPG